MHVTSWPAIGVRAACLVWARLAPLFIRVCPLVPHLFVNLASSIVRDNIVLRLECRLDDSDVFCTAETGILSRLVQVMMNSPSGKQQLLQLRLIS